MVLREGYCNKEGYILLFLYIFYPKVEILSSFTHHHVFSNLYEYFFCETKKKKIVLVTLFYAVIMNGTESLKERLLVEYCDVSISCL